MAFLPDDFLKNISIAFVITVSIIAAKDVYLEHQEKVEMAAKEKQRYDFMTQHVYTTFRLKPNLYVMDYVGNAVGGFTYYGKRSPTTLNDFKILNDIMLKTIQQNPTYSDTLYTLYRTEVVGITIGLLIASVWFSILITEWAGDVPLSQFS